MLFERLDLPVCLLALISLHINSRQGITSAVDMKAWFHVQQIPVGHDSRHE
jgi:hypothetical protein